MRSGAETVVGISRGPLRPGAARARAGGIDTPRKLAQRSEGEILALHGVGPSTIPVLRKKLSDAGLAFRTEGRATTKPTAKPATIDAYLATIPPDRRAALEKLRKTIRSILPDAQECISYSMPAFRYGGHVVGGFLATSKGCSFYPFSGTTLATLATQLKTYSQTKSALHFDPKRPLPRALVQKLLAARIAETRDT